MAEAAELEAYLSDWAASEAVKLSAAKAILAICDGAIEIADLISQGRLAGNMGEALGGNAHGDVQKQLDVRSNNILIEALRRAPVSAVVSEEMEHICILDGTSPVVVAMDPLDGSSNIENNVSIGTIFSILPILAAASIESAFLQAGSNQCAAGYIVYGPQTLLVVSLGRGTHVFTLNRNKKFVQSHDLLVLPDDADEYAINASNYRHWSENIRSYIDDCVAGADGPRGRNLNMRWIASLVADCHRILISGGVFLYPRDQRTGYENGRLRLIYEANPIAFLVEQAGGKAVDGFIRTLDIVPTTLHQRVPLIFGCPLEVDRICQYKLAENPDSERSPLFGRRGLLRA